MRTQIGTVRITRPRIYPLDPLTPDRFPGSSVVVEPGEYPVYETGFTRYWRMTGVLDENYQRLGDGMFASAGGDVRSDDDVVFYSRRFGPDEWTQLMTDCAADLDPALIFSDYVPADQEA